MITTKEQLEEALVAYKKELESKFTIDALGALYPKGAITTKTIELKQFYGRTISITDLEAIIKEAKSVGTNHIYIFERRGYDSDFQSLEFSCDITETETESAYIDRLKKTRIGLINTELKSHEGRLQKELTDYNTYIKLKKEFEK